MPLTVDNIIQSASGTFEGTSGTMTLPAATTAGSVVIAVVGSASNAASDNGVTPPDSDGDATFMLQLGRGPTSPARSAVTIWGSTGVASGLTSWTVGTQSGTSRLVAWVLVEVSGVAVDPVIAASVDWWDNGGGTVPAATSLVNSATSAPVPATSTGVSEAFEAFGLHAVAASRADTTVPTISGYDGEYSELAQISITNADTALALAVATGTYLDAGNFTAGLSVSPDAYVSTDLILLYADTAPRVQKYALIFGAEIGTITNATAWTFPSGSPNGIPALRATVGSPEIVSNIKRSGSYALKLSSTSAAESVTLQSGETGATNAMSVRVHFYFDTSLPGSDVELLSMEANSSLPNGMKLVYRTASQKLGVQVDTGTEVLSDTTVAVDKWIGVDLRFYVGSLQTAHCCDWQVAYDSLDTAVDSVVQTTAVGTRDLAESVTLMRVGWTTSTTATVYYDDIAVARTYLSYPLGDVRVLPLKVDPAGAPAVSGTSTNFRTFTANGTLATWTAAATRDALDDIPPTIGASSDGLTQITVAATDYVDIPIETYPLAPLYCARALRIYWCGWAASTTASTCNLSVVDANSLEAYRAASGTSLDMDFDNSTLRWLTGMLNYTYSGGSALRWYEVNQAILDGLSVRFGFSEDAAPDVGLHAVLFELAVQPAKARGFTSAEDGTFSAYGRFDPVSGALASMVVTTPVGGTRGATLYIDSALSGVPDSQHVNGDSFAEVSIGATRVSDVAGVALALDPSD